MKTYHLYDLDTSKKLLAHPHPSLGQPARWQRDTPPENPNPEPRNKPWASPIPRATNLVWLEVVDRPEFDPETHIAERNIDEVALTDGWAVRELTAEELAARQPTTEQQLNEARSGMSGLIATLPVESRAKFASVRAAIEKLLDVGDIPAANYVLQNTATDTTAEATVKATILGALSNFLP